MKILTLQQLAHYCANNNLHRFSSEETGHKVYVQVPGNFEVESDSHKGLLFTKLKVCHTLLNRNGSYISEDNMKRAMPSLKYRPILAYIHQLDNGEWDFHKHDMEYVEDEDGNEELVYHEKQIGSFTEDEPYLEYDPKEEKTYVMAIGVVPEEYTKAADIIRRKNGTKVSCELCIEKFSYNAKEKYLELEDFYFTGVTALGSREDGTEIQEGMVGSRMDTFEKSSVCTSMYSNLNDEFNHRMIELLEQISAKVDDLRSFTINENSKEGGILGLKFEELLQKYGKTAEEIDFEYESMTEEELAAKFEELFGESTEEEEVPAAEEFEDEPVETEEVAEEIEVTEEDEEQVEVVVTEEVEEVSDEQEEVVEVEPSFSVTMRDGSVHTFALSLNDKIYALSDLVNATYCEQDNCWYSVTVYDENLVMVDFWGGRAYRQSYSQDGDSFMLTGDRVEVYQNWLTAEEESALSEMKQNYALIETRLAKYEAAELKVNKENLMKSDDYSSISDKEDFTALAKKVSDGTDNFSLDELKNECDKMLLNYAKAGSLKFSAEPTSGITKKVGLPVKKSTKKGPYGSLKFN